MGKNQSTPANWSVDGLSSETGENAVSFEDVLNESKKIPEKYFGGQSLENNPAMHEMQRDLLSFDETLKGFFRKKKNPSSINNIPTEDGYYYYEEEQQQPIDTLQNQNYLEPTFVNENSNSTVRPVGNSMNYAPKNPNKLFWRCTNCMAENKKTEHACRRCGEAETQL
jgi:hypothetical protein